MKKRRNKGRLAFNLGGWGGGSATPQNLINFNADRRQVISRRKFVGASAAALVTLGTRTSTSGSAGTLAGAARFGQVVPHREPLAKIPFLPLPLGSVRARGWLQTQLELQRDGLTGRADSVLPGLDHASSAWLNPQLEKGEDWEKGPYYVKGLVPLAFTLQDEQLKARAAVWVEAILASQQHDGFYGPRNNDWWPRMVTNYLLRDYYEATSDERIPCFLAAYYTHLKKHLPGRPLKEWGRARAGDEIDTIFWFYNRTGDDSLLKLADLLYAQAYPWHEIFAKNTFLANPNDFHPKHAVNVAQALKGPTVYWQRSGSPAHRNAYQAAIDHLAADHGTSFGINTGTEFVSGRSTVEGVELCAIAEKMLSCATVLRILGDPTIGDELELLAFNALPAALSKPFRQHVYYTLANNVAAPRGLVGYEIDYDDARTPAPRSGCPCCCYNLHMAGPKLVQNAWAATPAGGLAALAYLPSEVTAQVADGAHARIMCTTNYPFEESVALTVNVDRPTQFPLHLRIPAWCERPVVRINRIRPPTQQPRRFVEIDRTWTDGDTVELEFPMLMTTRRSANNSLSIRRGPLVYSLAMEEKWSVVDPSKQPGFESFAVSSPTPWNYALKIDDNNPSASTEVSTRPIASNPFETGKATPTITVLAKRVDGWRLRHDGLVAHDPPLSPLESNVPLEKIKLVPFGSQMLRITDFPVLGEPAKPLTEWNDRFAAGKIDDWLIYRGGYLSDSALRLVKGAKAVVNAVQLTDLRLNATLQVGDTGDAGIIFRVTEPSIGVDHYRGYYVGIDAAARAVIIGKADNRWTEITRKSAPILASQPHTLRVEARGDKLQVWLDDNETALLTINDASHTSGTVGVRSYANRAAFSRVHVEALVS
jgi:hypothetical protein